MSAGSGPQDLINSGDPASTSAGARSGSLEARLLGRLLSSLGDPPIEFLLAWSGERVGPRAVRPVSHVRILDRKVLLGMLRDPQVRFGDAYSAGQVEIDGDLIEFMDIVYRAFARADVDRSLIHRLAGWVRRPRRNTMAGSRDNIHRHYDLGNDFYALWLGETMAYTCAYYPSAAATLEQAQIAKMDHVCRKLRIGAGDSVVEAGCGWGSLALHIASRYGAKVRAFNISKEQIEFARARAREQGLEGRVEFVSDDYRNISGSYDVFVSVGMLEHVGRENYPQLGRVVRRSLTAAGRGLIHSIGRNRPAPLHPWIERRIFPGAYAPSLAEMTQIFEPFGLSVLDVENIRPHYALTLRHWLERYERTVDRVRSMFDERFVRMWRLYLAGSAAAFETGTLQLFQVLFTTQENNAVPLTREFMYPGRPAITDA
ncbi:MAG TPA: cyclopropane-fatty-acyl-phospholipid synthase family protein [Steroidobacteraceae bacterium]|jgi:cyclopropane-fatty-acyl-phospholipid synthase|nr:cyclopropane-fatty-acyl-phospholipid synthase family protein [Steroidobacteraceae bacterium]